MEKDKINFLIALTTGIKSGANRIIAASDKSEFTTGTSQEDQIEKLNASK